MNNENAKIEAVKAVVKQLSDAHRWDREHLPECPRRHHLNGMIKAYDTVLQLLDMDLDSINDLLI